MSVDRGLPRGPEADFAGLEVWQGRPRVRKGALSPALDWREELVVEILTIGKSFVTEMSLPTGSGDDYRAERRGEIGGYLGHSRLKVARL